MFKCQLTGRLIGPGVSPKRVIVEKRERTYENKVKGKVIVSQGWEIVKELIVDPSLEEEVAKHEEEQKLKDLELNKKAVNTLTKLKKHFKNERL